MSIRHTILNLLNNNGLMTLDELQHASGETNRKRLLDNLKAAEADGLVEKKMDDVTRLPARQITDLGRQRIKAAKFSINGKNAAQNTAESKAKEIAAEIPLNETRTETSEDEAMPPADANLLASANRMLHKRLEGVAHALRGSGLPGLANVEGSEDLQPHTAALTGAYQMAMADVANLRKIAHDQGNDLAAATLVLNMVGERLQVPQPEDIPAALNELLHAFATRATQAEAKAETIGKTALILIDSTDLTEIEELDQYDVENAQQLAMRSVEQGRAARAIVVRILGEASRKVVWKAAA